MILRKERDSGIELLKILAIAGIILFHITQSLTSIPDFQGYNPNAFLDFSNGTNGIQEFVIMCFQNLGAVGNDIFFCCSAWFLCDCKKVKPTKVVNMLITVWSVNMIFLLAFLVGGFPIGISDVIKSFFPTLFSLNWYITCYLIFYCICPYINRMIKCMNQKEMLNATVIMTFLYCCVGMVLDTLLFPSNIIIFIVIYFIVSYMKQYLSCSNNIKVNVIILILNIIFAWGLMILFTEVNNVNLNPGIITSTRSIFNILIAVSSFNLFRQLKIKNNIINSISSCTLLIYIIHENIYVRKFLRPEIFMYIYKTFGYDYILLWTLLVAAAFLVSSIILAIIYKKIFSKLNFTISCKITEKSAQAYDKFSKYLMKID